jgi:hypothetical protein
MLFAAALAGCVTEPEGRLLRVGMSQADLRARFGEPLRIESGVDGGEDWYYPFTVWAKPEVQMSSVPGAPSSSAGLSISRSWSVEELPVHVSESGCVLGPLPHGKIVHE